MTYVKAQEGFHHNVIYQDDTGKYVRFSGGTWTWRNHNPGNLMPGKISKKHGQIGIAGKFAVFPDEESGRLALLDCLITTYGDSSIDKLVEGYAPPKENDVVRYRKFLHKQTGVEDDKKIKDFTEDEFTKLWKAIIKYEGYKIGTITTIQKVDQVKKNKKRLCELHLNELGWKQIEECVSMAKASVLELVVCHSSARREYLRAHTHDPFQPNLSSLTIVEV
jgi:hypothetical protein